MARKERIVPQHEGLERPIPTPDLSTSWWDQEPGRMQRLHPDRKPPKVKKTDKTPSWTIVIMLLGLVLIVGGLLVATLDFRKGHLVSLWHENANSTPSNTLNWTAVSPDKVKARLQAHGFKVEYLDTIADPKGLAYDVAETHIDGTKALILVFKDPKSTQKWVERSKTPTAYTKTWVVAANDLDLINRISAKLKVDLHG
jgi:hypothetical protein